MSHLICDIDIYCINLERRKDRKILMLRQFKRNKIIERATFIKAVDAKNENILSVKNISLYESACLYSHLKALKKFLESQKKYCLVLEDDSNIDNTIFFDRSFLQLVDSRNNDDYIIQLQPIVRLDHDIEPKMSERTFWNFGTGAYIVTQKYAQRIIDNFENAELINKNFVSENIADSRGGTLKTTPTAESILYSGKGKSFTLPVFTTTITDSDLNHINRDEAIKQEVRSNNLVNSGIKAVSESIKDFLDEQLTTQT
jgi:GR25 family glycosyltransferase involved in LPS biosynthesis